MAVSLLSVMKGFLNEMPPCIFRRKISDKQTSNGCLLPPTHFLSHSDLAMCRAGASVQSLSWDVTTKWQVQPRPTRGPWVGHYVKNFGFAME